jgi:predicted DNA-binding transcriptional regulator YafY
MEENVWKITVHALQTNSILEFDYSGRWNTETTHRRVHPYQIVMDDGKFFLYGFSVERNDTRLFSLGNIKNLVKTEDTFTLPENFDFESTCGGGKFGSFSSGTKELYKIEFYENARQMVKECVWADDQKLYDDDSRDCTTIEFSSTQFFKIEEWILAQGCYAKPLSPQWLVDDWKDHIARMVKLAEM